MSKLALTIICVFLVAHIRATPIEPQPSSISGRIIDGQDAHLGEFPHQVTVRWDRNTGEATFHRCGGSIIDAYHVLTAAHCQLDAPGKGFFVIWAGKLNLDIDEPSLQSRKVIREFYHSKYINGLEPHDIAVMRVEQPFVFNSFVRPIALAQANHKYVNEYATISGWGSISRTSEHVRPSVMQKLDVPMISGEECDELLVLYAGGKKHGEDNICAGSDAHGHSTCGGDSGGPLVQRDDANNLVQIGVVSWGFAPCGASFRPAVYAAVQYHLDFIEDSRSS